MLPIGPLMIEHRLIMRMINVMRVEFEKLQQDLSCALSVLTSSCENIDDIPKHSFFINQSVDFIKTYADRTHHGKEEDILFEKLKNKDLQAAHLKTMNELIGEHIYGRETTKALVNANKMFIEGDMSAGKEVLENLEKLIKFYPNHIEKEDKHFFIQVMDYFSEKERSLIIKEFQDFDRKMIHEKYLNIVKLAEIDRGLKFEEKEKWLNYI